jgi:hypothetical protein
MLGGLVRVRDVEEIAIALSLDNPEPGIKMAMLTGWAPWGNFWRKAWRVPRQGSEATTRPEVT